MQIPLKVALVIITLLYLFFVLKKVKQKKLQIGFSLFWVTTGVVLIIALLIPNLVEEISTLLGFELTVNMIFCIAIFLAFFLIFNLNILLSKENSKNTLLIQEISILKKRVEELENKDNK